MFFLFILLVVVPAGNQMQAKRSKELSFNHSVPMFQALGVQQSVSCGNRLLSQCLTMGRGGHRVWYRVDFPFLLPAPRIGVDNLNVPAPDLFPVGGEGGAPLPLLVGNISSGRGPGGCKLLIQTPPSMTLGNWIGKTLPHPLLHNIWTEYGDNVTSFSGFFCNEASFWVGRGCT